MTNKLSQRYPPDWNRIRSDFELDPEFIHLVGFWLSTHSRPVKEAIASYRLGLDRNPYLYLRNNEHEYDNSVRAALARFLGADPSSSIVLTESTTDGLGLVLGGIVLPSSTDVITTTHEHYSAWKTTELFAHRNGARLKRLELYNTDQQLDKENLVKAVVDHVTTDSAVLVLTWVHSDTGVLLPIEAICRELRAKFCEGRSPLVIVDATHAVGAVPLLLRESRCDIVIASCHKWLLGPRGTAFVWGRKDALEQIDAWMPTFSSDAIAVFTGRPKGIVLPGERLSPGGFHCFEHRWGVTAAVEYLENIGTDEAFCRIRELSDALKRGLATIEGVRVVTPQGADVSAGFVCFEVIGQDSHLVCAELEKRRVLCSPGPYRRSFCRFSPFIYNSTHDLSVAVDAVAEVAFQLR